MKRLVGVCTSIVVLLGMVTGQPAHAGVDDFTFKEFIGDYYLSKDEDGRSRLKVVETFTAEFPHFDQNKGVVRAIPNEYDGHPVDVRVESLTCNGQSEPIYSQEQRNRNTAISSGTDEYVHGDQTYQ